MPPLCRDSSRTLHIPPSSLESSGRGRRLTSSPPCIAVTAHASYARHSFVTASRGSSSAMGRSLPISAFPRSPSRSASLGLRSRLPPFKARCSPSSSAGPEPRFQAPTEAPASRTGLKTGADQTPSSTLRRLLEPIGDTPPAESEPAGRAGKHCHVTEGWKQASLRQA